MGKFALEVVATRPGFYFDREHFEPGSRLNPARAGIKFVIREDALRYDDEGRMEVEKREDGKLYPILPSWVKPLGTVEPIDPKTPHVIVDPKRKKKRIIPEGVKAAAPKGWPLNVKKRMSPDPERVVKIARRGGGSSDEDED